MADKIIVSKSKVTNLFDSIRAKSGSTDLMSFDVAKESVDNIETGGGVIEVEELPKVGSEPVAVPNSGLIERFYCNTVLSKQEDFWSISSKNNIITLAGSNQRGLFYAISHFLEDYCNVFFFTPYEEYVPKKQELSLSTIKASGQPYFTYRHIYRGDHFSSSHGDGQLSLIFYFLPFHVSPHAFSFFLRLQCHQDPC